jgi:ubiquinone/menaquinone biosynthesis C-methylase UbiE
MRAVTFLRRTGLSRLESIRRSSTTAKGSLPTIGISSNNKAAIQDEFSRQAPLFEAQWEKRSRRSTKEIMNIVFGYFRPFLPASAPGPAGLRALDVATGTGIFSRFLAAHPSGVCSSVTGVDVTPGMLAQAKSAAAKEGVSVSFVEGDAADMRALFADGSFDLVVCRLAVHHFASPQQQLAEMCRVCRKGGLVVIVDLTSSDNPAIAAEHNRLETLRDPSHTRALSPAEIAQLLQDCSGGSHGQMHVHSSSDSISINVNAPSSSCVEARVYERSAGGSDSSSVDGRASWRTVRVPFVDNDMNLQEWMDTTGTAPHSRRAIEQALRAELLGHGHGQGQGAYQSGMRPFFFNKSSATAPAAALGELEGAVGFTHRWVCVAATKL